eukprot:8688108-Heterocapsa_arctica.AAC.1
MLYVTVRASTPHFDHANFMRAYKIDADRASGTSELEIINIDHQIQLEFRVKVARGPLFGDREEANFADVGITMFLPKGPAIGVS